MSSNASSLLASLTGEENQAAMPQQQQQQQQQEEQPTGISGIMSSEEPDQDLFGDIPIDTDETEATTANTHSNYVVDGTVFESAIQEPPRPAAGPTEQQPPMSSSQSLLASSGLLPTESPTLGNGGGGGGLFDQVDQQQAAKEAEEQRQKAAERERERLLQQQQQQQAAAQQQQLQQQQPLQQKQEYTNVPLQSPAPPTDPMQQMSLNAPQQQQYQHQQHYPGMSQQQPVQHQPGMYQPTPAATATQYYSSTSNNNNNNNHVTPTQGGFYRSHAPLQHPPEPSNQQQQQQQQQPGGTHYYSTSGGPVQQHVVQPSVTTQGRYGAPGAAAPATLTAGLHNGRAAVAPKLEVPTAPEPAIPVYGQIKVSDPMMEQGGLLGFSSPPHWTYQITTNLLEGGFWIVRRRFRHVVALEERLMADCPGAILPPRPEKHATRAIEEASSTQSAEFAMRRMQELTRYLNALASHPVCSKSQVVRLFLALQDDIGTAWPEVSTNALTRFATTTQGVASKLTDSVVAPTAGGHEIGEDNAELIALQNTENVRMGAVLQAVPKLEGFLTLLREEGEIGGHVGMEMSKLSKDVEGSDRELSQGFELMSQGLLRASRRSKRLSVELGAATTSYIYNYKLCRYEKAAFQDRRNALAKKQKERSKADVRAQRLAIVQAQAGVSGGYPIDRTAMEASMSDTMAMGAGQECDEIGRRLQSEVNRVAFLRRKEWNQSMKVIASAMKEANSERAAIWESTREAFLQAFPEEEDGVAAAN